MVYKMVLLGGFLFVNHVFPMYSGEQLINNVGMIRYGGRSFRSLVSASVLDDKLLCDVNKLKATFRDINIRFQGLTPLHRLIIRPDAKVEYLKALLECGADPNVPSIVIYTSGKWFPLNTYKTGIKFSAISPTSEFKHQYFGNKEVMNYIFCVMLEQKIQEKIQRAQRENKLQIVDEGSAVIILPPACAQYGPEMAEDEARIFLNESIKDQREFELFVKNLSPGAFDVFLKMQENFVTIAEQK